MDVYQFIKQNGTDFWSTLYNPGGASSKKRSNKGTLSGQAFERGASVKPYVPFAPGNEWIMNATKKSKTS